MKCKVLIMVCRNLPPLLNILPFIQFHYPMSNNILEYMDTEKDLGVSLNRTLDFTELAIFLYSKDSQRFGLLKITCHFVKNNAKKRVLYLALGRSLFEHCPTNWRPSSNTVINKLKCIQKRAIRWINGDYSHSHSSNNLLYSGMSPM